MFGQFANSPFANNFVLQYAQILLYHDNNFSAGETNYHKCDTPANYLFWDEIHPSTKIHRYFAYDICLAMKEHGYNTTCQEPNGSKERVRS